MKFKGRFWKKSFYSQEESGPYEFFVDGNSPEQALKNANDLMVRTEIGLSASVISKCELLIDKQWKRFGPKGFE